MEINREEYTKALDIVEEYHSQLNLSIVKCSFSKIKSLQETDFVECVKTDNNVKKCLTIGKKYQIIGFTDNKYQFILIDDNGKKKKYRTDYYIFKAVIPNYA